MQRDQDTAGEVGSVQPAVLRGEGLTVRYGDTLVLEGLDLRVRQGQVCAVMGPSGSGKSSLLACITGLHVPTSGTVQVAGREMSAASARQRADWRRTLIGVTYQSSDLLPELDVRDNVALPLMLGGTSRATARAVAEERLREVSLQDHVTKRVDEISGGQAHRVSLARALNGEATALFVADEPTASLDVRTAEQMIDLILSTVRARGLAAVVATHDPRVAERCDDVLDLGALAVGQDLR